MNEIEKANELAAMCSITPEEIKMLFQGERRRTARLESTVWNESLRKEKCDAI